MNWRKDNQKTFPEIGSSFRRKRSKEMVKLKKEVVSPSRSRSGQSRWSIAVAAPIFCIVSFSGIAQLAIISTSGAKYL
ncbi:MAG: hypothetical protein Q8P34_16210 [Bacteroidota bacterium]|nr:hypothetical protein [Bacteroidota bacterium]